MFVMVLVTTNIQMVSTEMPRLPHTSSQDLNEEINIVLSFEKQGHTANRSKVFDK